MRGPTDARLREVKESYEQAMLMNWLRAMPHDTVGVFTATLGETGGYNKGRAAPANHNMGYRTGMPDILILKPVGAYHGAALELKRTFRPAALTLSQKKCLEQLSALGYFTRHVRGYWQARIAIEHYLQGVPQPSDAELCKLAVQRMDSQ